MHKKKAILYPVLFMMGLTAIYTIILASINTASAERIETQAALKTEQSILYANDLPYDLTDQEIHDSFSSAFKTITNGTYTYYLYYENDTIKTYTLPFSGKGLWGTIKGYMAFSSDFGEVVGIDFTSHSETPGLGGRIEELWFKEQFRGLTLESSPYIVYRTEDPSSVIDAITGATLTSKSVETLLNDFIEILKANPEEVMIYE